MPIIYPFLFKLLPGQAYKAMALWPFIFVKEQKLMGDKIVMNHEKIHLAQQLELLVLPFYFFYFSEYVFYRLTKKDHDKAYRNISFEREAYKFDNDLEYLKKRKTWASFKRS